MTQPSTSAIQRLAHLAGVFDAVRSRSSTSFGSSIRDGVNVRALPLSACFNGPRITSRRR